MADTTRFHLRSARQIVSLLLLRSGIGRARAGLTERPKLGLSHAIPGDGEGRLQTRPTFQRVLSDAWRGFVQP